MIQGTNVINKLYIDYDGSEQALLDMIGCNLISKENSTPALREVEFFCVY